MLSARYFAPKIRKVTITVIRANAVLARCRRPKVDARVAWVSITTAGSLGVSVQGSTTAASAIKSLHSVQTVRTDVSGHIGSKVRYGTFINLMRMATFSVIERYEFQSVSRRINS